MCYYRKHSEFRTHVGEDMKLLKEFVPSSSMHLVVLYTNYCTSLIRHTFFYHQLCLSDHIGTVFATGDLVLLA